MSDDLDVLLARAAREHHLNLSTVHEVDETTLRSFCEVVLREVTARGYLPGEAEPEPDCHATRRIRGN